MQIIEKILVPIGFEQRADILLGNVKTIAKKFNSEVVLLHVLPENIKDSNLKNAVVELIKEYRDILIKEDIKCSFEVKSGEAVDVVVETSKKEKVNIIVVGSGDVRKNIFRLGSTSEKIIRNSEIPVWVVEKESSGEISKVLCPVDFSDQSKLALNNAIHICRRYDSELIILSVVKSNSEEYKKFGMNADIEEKKYTDKVWLECDTFLKDFNFSGIKWSKELKFGNPADEILKYIPLNNVDLVIMGSTGKTRFSRFLIGSVTEKVSRKVPCSFIITKSESLIRLKVENELKDIDELFKEGVQLAKDGFMLEAIGAWKKCTALNEFYLKAWSAISVGYEELGEKENAQKYADLKEKIQRSIWDKQIEADLRSRHGMFG